ncbi:ExeA family protein, partial [Arenibaculum sp.]|uniref:ExeA family protein n=1 Tax=Arenibaculum sp. TaxID=2865862 RepID=UPI002E0FC12A|nr:AAA family ATPase [Arenibaculum sp.]
MMNSPFGLREEPFDIEDPLRAPFASADHKEAFNGFFLAIMARKRVMALFGETGMGKTTLLRSLIRHIEADGAVVLATTARPGMTVEDLILSARPDIEPEAVSDTADPEALEAVVNDVEERIENAGTGLLVVDEAHLLDLPVLTDLIELASSDTETGRYLQVLIAGDHKLERKLAEPELEAAFRQYGAVHYLPPLDRDAAEAFIRDRLRLAGAPQLDMFLPSAVDAATQLSAGLPGVLGAICGQALRIAAQARRHRVDASHVQEAATALGIETAPDIEIDIPDPALYAEVREPIPVSSAPAAGRAGGTEPAPHRHVDPSPTPHRPSTRGIPPASEPPSAEAEADPWPELSAPRREDAYEDQRRPKTNARWVAAGLAVFVLAAGAGLALSLTEPGTLRSFYAAETDAPRPVAAPAPAAQTPAGAGTTGAGTAGETVAAAPPPQSAPSRSVPDEPAASMVPADSIAGG